LSDPSHWTETWHANWPSLRQALQTAIAACLAFAATDVLALPQGFWAVVTAITVMQANVGASVGQAVDRLFGSLLGVVVGGAVAILLADSHALKYAGLALSVLVLAFVSARRPPLRIACVTAAIVVLGDPRLSPPIPSAAYRMLEVMIGAAIASATSMLVFPSRSGPALAAHVHRTMPLYFEVLRAALTWALGPGHSQTDFSVYGRKIRAALATTNSLAADVKVELAGYLAHYPDPDALVRTLRRLWHTEIMLVRSVSSPLPAAVLSAVRLALERLIASVDEVLANCTPAKARSGEIPDTLAMESAVAALEADIADLRTTGSLRPLAMDDFARLMTFDFALGQLRDNLRDLRERGRDLAELTGSRSVLAALPVQEARPQPGTAGEEPLPEADR
jgi:uncharacterized membrane protein YccC